MSKRPRPHPATDKHKNGAAPIKPLWVSRKTAAQLLGGVNVATIRRLERAGRLKARRLTRSASAQVFYRLEEIERIAEGSDA